MRLVAQGDVPGAGDALQKVIDSGDAELAPPAAGVLGALLAYRGDEAGAKDAFQTAIDSGHTEAAPKTAFVLGDLLAGPENVGGREGV
jgi:hypothetical protein